MKCSFVCQDSATGYRSLHFRGGVSLKLETCDSHEMTAYIIYRSATGVTSSESGHYSETRAVIEVR
jgi:hypothetical protein